jgi:DNA-directed RNA polymerase specialized sigma subunit
VGDNTSKGFKAMNIKNFLNQAYYLELKIQANRQELTQLRELAASIKSNFPSGDKVQSGSIKNSLEDTAARIADFESVILADVRRCVKLKRKIYLMIHRIPDERSRLILQQRYIKNLSWKQIADNMGYDVSSVFKLHKEALKQLQKKTSSG